MKVKGKRIVGIILFALLLEACMAGGSERGAAEGQRQPDRLAGQAAEDETEISGVRPEECFWCGEKGAKTAPYWGQENVGFISLNSFEIAYVGINCYDDFGKRVNERTGGTMIRL